MRLSNRQEKWLQRALTLACNSTCRHRHGALVVKSGRVVGQGYNRVINNPMLFPDDMFNDHKEHISIHAEVAALNQVSPEVAHGAVLYVARTRSCGAPGMSRPCPRCQEAIEKAGIKKVVYSDSLEDAPVAA